MARGHHVIRYRAVALGRQVGPAGHSFDTPEEARAAVEEVVANQPAVATIRRRTP